MKLSLPMIFSVLASAGFGALGGGGAWMYVPNATGFSINGGTSVNSILTVSSAGTVTINGSGTISLPLSGGGNVTGPASSTNFAIARYNGTGGTTLSNSSVTIDNSGNLNVTAISATGIVSGSSADFRTGSTLVGNLIATTTISAGSVYASGTLSAYTLTATDLIVFNSASLGDTTFVTNVIAMPSIANYGALNFTGFNEDNNVVVLTPGDAITLLGVSDQRVKTNIVPFTAGASIVNAIAPIRFNFTGVGVDGKPDGHDTKTAHLSVSAQDIQKILPEAVSTLPNGTLSVDDRALLMAALNNLKELNAQVAILTASLSHPAK